MYISSIDYFFSRPNLPVAHPNDGFVDLCLSELDSLPDSPEDLSNQILGKQAEVLMGHYLKHSQRFQMLAAAVQIQGTKSTLGELDFLVFDHELDAPSHIEMACKFYLLDPELPKEEQWIGPNRRDSLKKKYDKWRTRQFPMLYQKETQLWCNKHLPYPVGKMVQQAYLRAFLFIPEDYPISQLSANERNCLAGTYRGIASIKDLDTNSSFGLPDKKQWLCPPATFEPWVSSTEARERTLKNIENRRSVLVYEKNGSTISQYFVVWWN